MLLIFGPATGSRAWRGRARTWPRRAWRLVLRCWLKAGRASKTVHAWARATVFLSRQTSLPVRDASASASVPTLSPARRRVASGRRQQRAPVEHAAGANSRRQRSLQPASAVGASSRRQWSLGSGLCSSLYLCLCGRRRGLRLCCMRLRGLCVSSRCLRPCNLRRCCVHLYGVYLGQRSLLYSLPVSLVCCSSRSSGTGQCRGAASTWPAAR